MTPYRKGDSDFDAGGKKVGEDKEEKMKDGGGGKQLAESEPLFSQGMGKRGRKRTCHQLCGERGTRAACGEGQRGEGL